MLSYFMGCIDLVRCVLVLRCGLAGVVGYPYAGFSLHTDTTRLSQINSEIFKNKSIKCTGCPHSLCGREIRALRKKDQCRCSFSEQPGTPFLITKKLRSFGRAESRSM